MNRDLSSREHEVQQELRERLADLDEQHKRARSPTARRRIERAMRDAQQEAAELVRLGKNVDEAFRRWVASLRPPEGTA